MTEREKELILKASPCEVNYFDRNLLTFRQALEKGRELCLNYSACESGGIPCALTCGWEVAQHIVNGSNLKKELNDFSYVPFINNEFWKSVNRRDFERIRGKPDVLSAVEHSARIILREDAFDSSLERCAKCDGVKILEIVYDTIRDGLFPCSGGGKTRRRDVYYCPKCEPKPAGGIIEEDDFGDAFFRKLSKPL